MSKRKKSQKAAPPTAADPAQKPAVHPPARRPVMLAISVLLFAAWLVFLAFVAWWG